MTKARIYAIIPLHCTQYQHGSVKKNRHTAHLGGSILLRAGVEVVSESDIFTPVDGFHFDLLCSRAVLAFLMYRGISGS